MNGTLVYITDFNGTSEDITITSGNIYVLLFILWPLTVFTILGNVLAIFAFVTDSKIQNNVTNRYILCLSVSDLIIGCVSLPLNNVWLHLGRWPFGEIVCKIWLVVDYAACYLSVMAILLLSYDRFLWVSHPFKYRKSQTVKSATNKILITTAFSFIFFTLPILFWDIWMREKHIDYTMDCEPENSGNVIYGLVFSTFETILPAIGICVLNITVYVRIRKACLLRKHSFRYDQAPKKLKQPSETRTNEERRYGNRQQRHHEECEGLNVNHKQNDNDNRVVQECISLQQDVHQPKSYINGYRKAGRRLAVMVGVFLFCWIPFNICLLGNAVCNDCIRNATWETVNYLLWGNSALNPVLYVLTNERYKRRMLSMIPCKKPMPHLRESSDFDLH